MISLSRTLFPEPLWPMTTMVSPFRMWRSKPSRRPSVRTIFSGGDPDHQPGSGRNSVRTKFTIRIEML